MERFIEWLEEEMGRVEMLQKQKRDFVDYEGDMLRDIEITTLKNIMEKAKEFQKRFYEAAT